MPSNRKISAILEFCRQTSDNVISLKNELASVKQEMTEMKQMMIANNNTGRSFINQNSFSIYQDDDEAPTAPSIQCPLPSQLDNDKPVFDQRTKYFIESWLKDAVVISPDDNSNVVDAKLAKLNSYKEMIVSLGSVAVDMMTKDLDLSDVNWPAIPYRNLSKDIQQAASSIDLEEIPNAEGSFNSLMSYENEASTSRSPN
ncbi:hypothetical protein BD560DRAFT_433316 [Blakeslea trispora]|nr:hypothetical protein BD560DRAFT_433316 [Blakeslea trispora]